MPRGVEHCPVALTDSVDVVLLEPSTTLNTGSAADELGMEVHEKSRGGVPLTKRELERFFGPWNGWLYKRLADERERGAAPPQEEAFAPFAERVRCV